VRALLFAGVLAVAGALPLRAQEPALSSPFERLLREPPHLAFHPAVAALSCCSFERRLDAQLRWVPAGDSAALALSLDAGVVAVDGEAYRRTGVAAHLRHEGGTLALSGTVGVGVGSGRGPATMLTATLGAGLPALRLDVRSTWFHDAPDDSVFFDVGGGRTAMLALESNYTDGELQAQHRVRRLRLRLTGGMRFGATRTGPPQWLWSELELPVWQRVSVVGAGGARPDRPELAQRGGRFALFALRWNTGPDAPAEEAQAAARDAPATAGVVRLGPGRYLLRLLVPGARRVELAGDFDDWRPIAMSRSADGLWEAALQAPAGSYHVNIRVDGGAWQAPAGLPAVPDRFGGAVGLLTLPPDQEASDA
jgi:hypothetical protein